MNASLHFFSEIGARVKSRLLHLHLRLGFMPFSCFCLPPLLLLQPSFSVYPLFSLLLLVRLFSFPSQYLLVNDTSWPILLCFSYSLVFPLFSLLFHVYNFSILLPESSLERGSRTLPLSSGHHSSTTQIVENCVFASVRN